ncbi:hypothetical protein [Pseudonocardia humida]|uniref:MFS transporter n=1 Tax=Pseudonocardia humida TaxID=2800819 RepID=A0ABT1AAU2_9PSEU|nr:hypothetical protein [Pseudonocardia humida]MCO1660160.1 hypothetical protein [Pseudonocardia humida]
MRGEPVRVRPAGARSTPPRALRAGLAAGLAVAAAVLAHAAGGGSVDPGGAAWAFAALVAPAWWLARRERGWGAIALTQLGAQQLVHVLLSNAGEHAAHGAHVLVGADVMLYAHLAAAALTGAWLRWGERRAWAAVRRFLLVVLPHLPPVGAAPAVGLPCPPVQHPAGALLRHAAPRRGPPVPAAS